MSCMNVYPQSMNGPFAPSPSLAGQNLDEIYQAKLDVQNALLSKPLDIQKAYRCAIRMLSIKCPWNVKYQLLPLAKIINDNCRETACLDRVVDCLKTIINKYGRPLLLPQDQRPSDWMLIRYKNEQFRTFVDFIRGAREILHHLGYTCVTDVGLAYPQNVEPMRERIAPLVAELMMAQHEILGYTLQTHPHPNIVEVILPVHIRRNFSPPYMEEPPLYQYPNAASPALPAPVKAAGGPGENHQASNHVIKAVPVCEEVHRPVKAYVAQTSTMSPQLHMPRLTNGNHSQPRPGPIDIPRNVDRESKAPPDEAPQLPIFLESVRTLNSVEGGGILEEIRASYQQIPGGIPHLPIFLESMGSEPEGAAAASPPRPEDERQRHQQDLAQKCCQYQQMLEDIDHKEKEIIRLNPDFYARPDYKAIRLERRQVEKLFDQARNALDSLDEQLQEQIRARSAMDSLEEQVQEQTRARFTLDSLEEQIQEQIKVQISNPPEVYVPPSVSKVVQPQDSNRENKTQLMPSGFPSGTKCSNCNVTLRHGEDKCFICSDGLLAQKTKPRVCPSSIHNPLEGASSQRSVESTQLRPQEEGWVCTHCSYKNPSSQLRSPLICEVCAKTSTPEYLSMVNGSPTPGHALPSIQPQSLMVKIQEEEERILAEKQAAHRKFEEENHRRHPSLVYQLTDPRSDSSELPDLAFSRSPPKRSVSEILPTKTKTSPSLSEYHTKSLSEGNSLTQIETRAKLDELACQGKSLVSALKASEKDGFTSREFELAGQHCEQAEDILPWLHQTWRPMIAQLRSRVRQIDPQLTITDEEARRALFDSKVNITKGTELAIHYKLEKIHEVMKYGPFVIEEVEAELAETGGNVMETAKRLTQRLLLKFTRRISEAVDQPPLADPSFMNDVADGGVDVERRLRMLLAEGQLQSWGRAELALRIINHSRDEPSSEEDWSQISLEDIVEAVESRGDYRSALNHLQQECQVCYLKISKNKLRSLVCCECNVCTDCLRQHFEIRVRERHVRDWVCPVCSEPDIEDEERRDQHFQFMDLLLKDVVKQEVFDLFEEKLRDWSLMNDPNFRWCSHCDFGQFQGDDATLKITCSKCHKHTCFECRKPWEDQHENLTCEAFREWKEANDPELQQQGLAKVLAENGIDCPACKFRYALAKGGCMHFKCIQCRHEFCSGCLRPFKRGKNCNKDESCKQAGLHCHHPRDCLFYMRDYDVKQLQKLLKDHTIAYNKSGPERMDGAASAEGARNTCPVMEQKELPTGLKDEACGLEVLEDHAGLCEVHYKEYLVGLINKNSIDPVEIMDEKQLVRLLEKNHIPVTPRRNKDTSASYRAKLIQLIQDNIPLPAPAGRVPLLQAAQATGQAKQDPGRTPKKNFPQGIRRIPVENAEEAVRWI